MATTEAVPSKPVAVEKSCGTCLCWGQLAGEQYRGTCRARAPLPASDGLRERSVWPVTSVNDWCVLDWTARETAPVEQSSVQAIDIQSTRLKARITDTSGVWAVEIQQAGVWKFYGSKPNYEDAVDFAKSIGDRIKRGLPPVDVD